MSFKILTSFIHNTTIIKISMKMNLKFAFDLASLFGKTMTMPSIKNPMMPGEGTDKTDKLIYNEKIKEYVKQV